MNRFLLLPIMCVFVLWSCSHVSQASTTFLRPQCIPEFETCFFRDCCEGFTCTTNTKHDHLTANKRTSVCLSDRSIALDAKPYEEKLAMMRHFFEDLVPPASRKSTDQIRSLVAGHKNTFPRLVARLEKRYKVSLLEANYNEEL